MVCRPDGDDDSAKSWQTAAAVEATTVAAVMLVSNATAMPAATQSAADGGPIGDNESAAIAMQ